MALFDDEHEQSADGTENDSGGDDNEEPVTALETATDDDPSGTLKRAVDSEAGVVIYLSKNGSGCGLSTVPLSETDLAPAGDQ